MSKLPVNICQIAPPNYPHHQAFDELVVALLAGFASIGCSVSMRHNALAEKGINIMVGANLLTAAQCARIGPETIIYNLEQIDEASTWLTPHYRQLLGRLRVLDYSADNARRLTILTGNTAVAVLPVAYVPNLSRVTRHPAPDVDVLFYGSINDRRRQLIDALKARGVTVAEVFGLYGSARDQVISRAKLVLNVHFYESSVFEVVRVSYLLANRVPVVSERGTNTAIYPWLADACRFAEYSRLPDAVEELLADSELLSDIGERGFRDFSAKPIEMFLKPLSEFLDPPQPPAIAGHRSG
jgi:hypothetical protein